MEIELDGMRDRFDELVRKETDTQSKLREVTDECAVLRRELGERDTLETQNDILRTLGGLVRGEEIDPSSLSRSAHLLSGEFHVKPPAQQ